MGCLPIGCSQEAGSSPVHVCMQKAPDIDQLTTDYIQHLGGMHPSVCLVPLKIMSRGSHETQLDTELSARVGTLPPSRIKGQMQLLKR